MRCILPLVWLVAGACALFAKIPPLTLNDVSLMLRSGYSASAVEAELGARRFVGSLDVAGEQALANAGAPAGLIEKLKSGAYTVAAEGLENAQKELLIQAQQRAAQAQEGQKLNMAYQEQLARQRASGPAPATARTIAGNAVMPLLKGDLVTSRNGILQTLNDQPLENKKLYALYFAAKWCPTCRKFTPQLVEFYNRVAPTHPEFEVVFISSDRSAPAMEAYMRDAQMPWPALKYDQIAEKQGLLKYAGNGIPCLVVVDSTGRVISDSFAGKQYLGPMKVLADLETILGGSMPAAGVGQSR